MNVQIDLVAAPTSLLKQIVAISYGDTKRQLQDIVDCRVKNKYESAKSERMERGKQV